MRSTRRFSNPYLGTVNPFPAPSPPPSNTVFPKPVTVFTLNPNFPIPGTRLKAPAPSQPSTFFPAFCCTLRSGLRGTGSPAASTSLSRQATTRCFVLDANEWVDLQQRRLLTEALGLMLAPCASLVGGLVATGGETARAILESWGERSRNKALIEKFDAALRAWSKSDRRHALLLSPPKRISPSPAHRERDSSLTELKS